MLVKNFFEYHDQDVTLEGYYSFDDALKTKRPLVLIAHDWTGRTEFNNKKAEELAELGYVGFALDMYGKGKLGKNNDEKKLLMTPFMEDRKLLQRRILSAYNAATQLEQVDASKTAAIGYCFGGTCALDLARTGVSLGGAVSFHGGLTSPDHSDSALIRAKLLILHGYIDKMVPLEQVAEFEKEMTAAKLDWQVHVYAPAMHAFTNPLANDPDFGTLYNEVADKRSWITMKNFLAEIFN